MKRFFSRWLYIFLTCCLVAVAPAARAEGNAQGGLRFGADGTFTVLLLSDLQETQFTTRLALESERGVLADYPPDLVVLLGDQLEGASPVLRLGSGADNCEKTIRALLAPIEESGVPFAVVFGNHDHEAPLSLARQAAIYESYANCVGVSFGANASESGAFSLPVYRTDGTAVELELFFFDCGPSINGDYGAVSAEQVAWYETQSRISREANGASCLPAVAFTHISPAEVYELFDETDASAKGAFKGVGSGAGRYYMPSNERIFLGEVNESPCPSSQNNGLFDAYTANGNVFLAVSGHDHVNSFIGTLRGVDIASVPGSSYTSYGDDNVRGARLFRFYEDNVRDYATTHVLYSNYHTPASYGFVRYYLSTTTLLPNAVKVALLILVLLLAAILLGISCARRSKRADADAAIDDMAEASDPGAAGPGSSVSAAGGETEDGDPGKATGQAGDTADRV